jgi:hypothetical protein
MPNPSPARPAADRNLLFGILALQMDFISRDALIAAKRKLLGTDNPRYAGEIAVVALNLLKHDAEESERCCANAWRSA